MDLTMTIMREMSVDYSEQNINKKKEKIGDDSD
jgi:hypothetical protein